MNVFNNYQQFSTIFHTTTVFRAILVNSFVMSLIAIMAIEIRKAFTESEKESHVKMDERIKGFISFCLTFVAGIIAYLLMYFIFNYGGGMVTINRNNNIVTPLFAIAPEN